MHPDDPRLPAWIREYTPGLLGVARAFAGGEDEAEDLLQEVWIVAFEKADDRPAGMPLGAWLHRVALNAGRTRRRRRLRRERLRAYWLGAGAAPRPQPVTGSPQLATELGKRALWRAIAELPALQRDALLLRVLEDMSTAQAAAALGRAEGTVKASLHRALAALREKLAGAFEVAPPPAAATAERTERA